MARRKKKLPLVTAPRLQDTAVRKKRVLLDMALLLLVMEKRRKVKPLDTVNNTGN
jgi:hypothetical protein